MQTVWKSGSEQDCRTLPTETVAGNAGFVYDWCRKHAMIHGQKNVRRACILLLRDKRMLAERAFFCLGQWNVRMMRILLQKSTENKGGKDGSDNRKS